jgi:hypothetical protein
MDTHLPEVLIISKLEFSIEYTPVATIIPVQRAYKVSGDGLVK